MPSLLPSAASAAFAAADGAGEILGELHQRFMSRLPAGGQRLNCGAPVKHFLENFGDFFTI